MKNKLLFVLNIVLIGVVGVSVYALQSSQQGALRSLKAKNPINHNSLTAENRDKLVTEVENLKLKVDELSKRKILVFSDEVGYYLHFSNRIGHTPPCWGGYHELGRGVTERSGLFAINKRSILCSKKIERAIVEVGSTCVKSVAIQWINGDDFSASYLVGTIDRAGVCIDATQTKTISGGEGNRELRGI